MKVLSTEGLTKLIQLIKSAFISVNDTETVTEIETVTTEELSAATIVSWGMPDYAAGVSVSPTIGTIYTAPKDGFFIISCNTANLYAYCYVQILDSNNNIVVDTFGNAIRFYDGAGSLASTSIPLPSGYKVKIIDANGVTFCAFYPMKGVN